MVLAILLAAAVVFLVNRLTWHYNQRWNISWDKYYTLSDKTLGMLSSLEDDVEVNALYQKSHPLYNDVYRILREYEYADQRINGKRRLKIEIIDTDRDLALAREKAIKYDVHKPNVVIFDVKGRTKYVEAKDLSDYKYELLGGEAVKTRLSFKGEQEFSSAILNVSQAARPKVYFLTGHGERSITDYGSQAGFSRVATLMRRDNMDAQSLVLNSEDGVPEDCSLLVIAGADRKISDSEIDMISKYLGKNGRLLCLLDPAVRTGMEPLLEKWGVKLAEDVVVGPSLSGRDLIINEYGGHPAVKKLEDLTTMFFMPRSVEPMEGSSADTVTASDKARASVLAFTTPGWAEMNLNENPARFHEGVDRKGPVSVAVAVEKGAIGGIDVEIKPTRIVVIGDSYFVSNGTLEKAVGGNVDLLMSCVSWLLERESLMAVSAKSPYELRLDMDAKQLRLMTFAIVGILPGIMGLMGLVVWLRRRS
jgi:ABC-type uncharacterized transport system involved in gliding motility auxiliary subunit